MESAHAGAAGGALFETDGKPARGFAFRRLPTLATLLFEAVLVNQLWPGNPVNRRYRCLDADYSQPQEIEQPAGACLAIARETWDEVGGFDEQFYPVWFEDVDLCKRLLERGGKIVYCPTARFRHRRSQRESVVLSGSAGVLVHKHAALRAQALHKRSNETFARGDHGRNAAALHCSIAWCPTDESWRNYGSILGCHARSAIAILGASPGPYAELTPI